MPASMRSYGISSSARHHNAFCTLTELDRPQIVNPTSRSRYNLRLELVPGAIHIGILGNARAKKPREKRGLPVCRKRMTLLVHHPEKCVAVSEKNMRR